MLYEQVLEIDERLDADGNTVKALDLGVARNQLAQIHAQGIRSIAIVFMHAWRQASHEAQVAQLAREMGFTQVSVSHEVSPLIQFVSRGHTPVESGRASCREKVCHNVLISVVRVSIKK